MALLSVIRRWHFREHLSIREIGRRTGLSRNTIRKYLRVDGGEPKFKLPERPSKLDPFADRLSAWLRTESKKSRKQKRTLKQLHAELVSLGYEGSYNRVAAFAREWKADLQRELQTTGRGTFVPLAFDPGEAFQFDWSEDWAIIGNERTKLQVAHTKLAYSRAFIVRAYLLQTHEMLFDAHNHAFRVFGGVPRRGIYDNMRTAIDKVGRGKERDVNVRFLAMANHYLYEPEFCNPASGWEKGQVEKNVQDARHRLFQPIPRFTSLEALNDWLELRCKEFWQQTAHGKMRGTIAEVWAEEATALMPASRLFDGFVEYAKRVSPTCLVHFDRNRYSVPASFANRPVSLRAYPDRIVIAAEGQIVCEHHRNLVHQPLRFDPLGVVADMLPKVDGSNFGHDHRLLERQPRDGLCPAPHFDDVLAILACAAFGHAEIGIRERSRETEHAARLRAADGARTADAHCDVITFSVFLVAVELVEFPRKNQRMHFKVLVDGRIEFSHDAPLKRVCRPTIRRATPRPDNYLP